MADQSFVLRLELEGGQLVTRSLEDVGAKGDAAMKKISRAVATEASPAMRGLNTAINEGGQVLDGYVRRAGPFGQVLASMGRGGLAAAAGIGAIAAATVVLTGKVRDTLTEMDDLADTAGKLNIGTEALQALRLEAREAGFELKDADAALRSLYEARLSALSGARGSEAQLKLFAGLGISRDELLTLENMEDLLDRVGAGARAMGNEVEGAAKLMKLGLQPLTPALMEVDGEIQNQIARWKALGLVFDDAIVQRGAKARGEMELLATKLDVALAPAFVKLGEVAIPVLEGMVAVLTTILQMLDGVGRGMEMAARAARGDLIGAAAAAMGPQQTGPKLPGSAAELWEELSRNNARAPRRPVTLGPSSPAGPPTSSPEIIYPTPRPKPDNLPGSERSQKALERSAEAAREMAKWMEEAKNSQLGLNLATDAFGRLMDGSVQSASDLLDLMVDILKQMIQMAAQQAIGGGGGFFDILGSIISGFFGGSGGSILGTSQAFSSGVGISSWFGGGRAGGGDTKAGYFYRWQETNGEQFFASNRNGFVQTAHAASAMAAREAQAARAGGGAPMINIQNVVHNNAGVEVEQRQTRDSNGGLKLETILNPKIDARMKENLQNGRTDSAMRSRLGARPRLQSR